MKSEVKTLFLNRVLLLPLTAIGTKLSDLEIDLKNLDYSAFLSSSPYSGCFHLNAFSGSLLLSLILSFFTGMYSELCRY